jgi:hypothetical protein
MTASNFGIPLIAKKKEAKEDKENMHINPQESPY